MRTFFSLRRSMLLAVGAVVALALSSLVACTVAPTASTQNTPEGTAGIGTPTVAPTIGPFNLSFDTQYALNTCDASQAAGTICVDTSGTGHGTNNGATLKAIGVRRSSAYSPGDGSTCTPATTSGTLTFTAQDTVMFTGTGTFCRATQMATFTYTIAGGTGKYQNASGSGSIHVPPPSSPTADTETWSGTLLT